METKILIVDDEEALLRLVKLNLEDTGQYQVRIENRAAQALATARAFKPDLILLDVMMPGRNGPEVACEIKADKDLQHIPIVFLTGADVKEARVEAEKENVDGLPFIEKPIGLQELIDCIEQNIDGSKS